MIANDSIFKTKELENLYFSVYQAVLDLWGVPHETLDISTRFGTTHINTAGPRDKPALILLPGFGANSTMWFPNIAALSSQYRVFAVDTNGQPGKSFPAMELTIGNSAEWIAELLDGLSIEKAHLAGMSLGGWLALNFAIYKPSRTARVILIDPAASFASMSPIWILHSLLPVMIHPTRAGLIRYFRWMSQGYTVDPNWGELMLEGILNIRPQPPIRAVAFNEAELRGVCVPVLVLIGGRSVIYDPRRALQRAHLIPGVQAEIVPNASHMMNAEAAEYVNARMLDFLK